MGDNLDTCKLLCSVPQKQSMFHTKRINYRSRSPRDNYQQSVFVNLNVKKHIWCLTLLFYHRVNRQWMREHLIFYALLYLLPVSYCISHANYCNLHPIAIYTSIYFKNMLRCCSLIVIPSKVLVLASCFILFNALV